MDQSEPRVTVQSDIPTYMLRLARQILRDCAGPGRYTITLDVPFREWQPRTVEISKVEKIRLVKVER